MTTPIVPSISDEQLAELERLADSIKGWNMPEAFQEAEEGVHPDEWEWHVGAIDEDGNQYPLLHVNAHQYDSGDSELLASYYAACNREAVLGLIARLRAAEVDAKRYRFMRGIPQGFGNLPCGLKIIMTLQRPHHWISDSVRGEALDKAIDAAMELTP